MRGRRGFSFPEIMIALAVTAIIAAMASVTYVTVRSNVSDRSAAPLLVSAQLELRRTVTDGAFPADPAAVMAPLPGTEYITGEPAGADQVSVYAVDATTVVLATPMRDSCLLLVDRIGAATGWARDTQGGSRCQAELAWAVLEQTELGTDTEPVEVQIP